MKARRNRIRLQKRRPRIRMVAVGQMPDGSPVFMEDLSPLHFDAGPQDMAAYVKFVVEPVEEPTDFLPSTEWFPVEKLRRPTFRERLRERLRILGWIFRRLLR